MKRHTPSLPLALECITFGSQLHAGHFSQQIRVNPICAVPHKNLSSTPLPNKKTTQEIQSLPTINAASPETLFQPQSSPRKSINSLTRQAELYQIYQQIQQTQNAHQATPLTDSYHPFFTRCPSLVPNPMHITSGAQTANLGQPHVPPRTHLCSKKPTEPLLEFRQASQSCSP